MDVLPPLQFVPIFQPYLWGGRRLVEWFPDAPAEGPVAEAWLVSDEAKHPSRVASGPLAGRTLRELMSEFGSRLLGREVRPGERFPLLLKFLDARDHLSVQVHPEDDDEGGVTGKTEAWVVLHARPNSRLYAGLRDGVDEVELRRALAEDRVAETLHHFEPAAGDCVFLPAGTVHAIGAGLMLFEVQQTSDITYRLHDWGRVDPRTGEPRELHVDQGLARIDHARGPGSPQTPQIECADSPRRERLVSCDYFRLWRHQGERPFAVGAERECRIVVAVEGRGELRAGGMSLPLKPGVVWLLPAEVGVGECRPEGCVTLLECGLPG